MIAAFPDFPRITSRDARERPRYDLAAVAEYVAINLANTHDLAERFGVNRRTVWRWREQGMADYTADWLAVRLGAHPWEIWGDDWFTPYWSSDVNDQEQVA